MSTKKGNNTLLRISSPYHEVSSLARLGIFDGWKHFGITHTSKKELEAEMKKALIHEQSLWDAMSWDVIDHLSHAQDMFVFTLVGHECARNWQMLTFSPGNVGEHELQLALFKNEQYRIQHLALDSGMLHFSGENAHTGFRIKCRMFPVRRVLRGKNISRAEVMFLHCCDFYYGTDQVMKAYGQKFNQEDKDDMVAKVAPKYNSLLLY